MEDKTLTCAGCGHLFVFSEKDQTHYQTKGFTDDPKRCKGCRAERRVDRGLAARPQFEHVCAQCGDDTMVPFPVVVGRPAFCGRDFEG